MTERQVRLQRLLQRPHLHRAHQERSAGALHHQEKRSRFLRHLRFPMGRPLRQLRPTARAETHI